MINKQVNNQGTQKLGINTEPLSLDDLPEIMAKVEEKLMPKTEYTGYTRQKMIKGRPYYFLIWYVKDEKGIRRQKSLYLGTKLPKGYSLGKSIKIASAK